MTANEHTMSVPKSRPLTVSVKQIYGGVNIFINVSIDITDIMIQDCLTHSTVKQTRAVTKIKSRARLLVRGGESRLVRKHF